MEFITYEQEGFVGVVTINRSDLDRYDRTDQSN